MIAIMNQKVALDNINYFTLYLANCFAITGLKINGKYPIMSMAGYPYGRTGLPSLDSRIW